MARDFPHLSAPGRIGALDLKNRFVVTAMGVGLAEPDGTWGERIRAYHETQAEGGAGLIISGAAGVAWPVGGAYEGQPSVGEDRCIEGLAAVVEAVHAHGAKFAVQLHHGGLNSYIDLAENRPLWGPSLPRPPRCTPPDLMLPEEVATSPRARARGINFRVMTKQDIQTVVDQFAAAARRAVQAGVDGLEIHSGHGYVIASFLSPRSNMREDEYGGTLENRARLLLEVIAAIRATVGREFPLWCKLDCREVGADPGITIEDAIATAKMAEAAGVDAVTVTANSAPDAPKSSEASHTPQIRAVTLPFAAQIKAAIKLPVISSGRVEPEDAESAIARGDLDFVSMGRKILADPALPSKVLAGRADEVRPCIYCYTCISNIVLGVPVRCAVNPRTGFESEAAAPPAGRKRVVVVGGGPGGMEAARLLDQDRHEVILLEKEDRLGGTLRFASLAYEENEALLDWLTGGIKASGVDVRTGVTATPELMGSLKPDAVVVASGARRGRPDIPGAELSHVFSGDDLRALMLGQDTDELKRKTNWAARLATKVGAATGLTANLDFVREATKQWMPLGERIVIIGADLVGMELAEFLAHRGRAVTIVDEAETCGAGLQSLRRSLVWDELEERGVKIDLGAKDIRIEDGAVTYADATGETRRADADHVILAKGATGDLSLARALRAAGFTVHEVGDCRGVGFLEGAMRSAAKVAQAISGST